MFHVPMYNIGGHASSWGHRDFLPLFHEAKVDLVITGHSHLYERFRPLAPRAKGGEWAITHITTGGGGAPLYDAFSHPALSVYEKTNHFVLFDVSREVLHGQAIRMNGTVLDNFTIRKPRGRPAPDYLAREYAEESLNLFYEFGPMLDAGVTAVPAADKPVEVLFNLPARASWLLPPSWRFRSRLNPPSITPWSRDLCARAHPRTAPRPSGPRCRPSQARPLPRPGATNWCRH